MLYEQNGRQVYTDSINHYINYFKNIVNKFKKINNISVDDEINIDNISFE